MFRLETTDVQKCVGAAMIGAGTLLATHVGGQLIIDRQSHVKPVTAYGTPATSPAERWTATRGNLEAAEILGTLVVMQVYGRRAYRSRKATIPDKPSAQPSPTDISLLIIHKTMDDIIDTEEAAIRSEVQDDIQRLGNELVFGKPEGNEGIFRLVDWGTHPDCDTVDAFRIRSVLEKRQNTTSD